MAAGAYIRFSEERAGEIIINAFIDFIASKD
jgi:hypothetical protein